MEAAAEAGHDKRINVEKVTEEALTEAFADVLTEEALVKEERDAPGNDPRAEALLESALRNWGNLSGKLGHPCLDPWE